jgi:ATP-dependent Clp protease ATP-binding subunit ClpC
MFERFTDLARRVIVLAQEEARLQNRDHIGTEHLLLGILHAEDGVASRVLGESGVTLGPAREKVRKAVRRGIKAPTGHIPFTPRCKKALEFSLKQSLQLGHSYIGPEHLLLGMIVLSNGQGEPPVGTQILQALEVDLRKLHEQIITMIASATESASTD